MSAEVLRRAASLMRDEWAPSDAPVVCACEDDGETFTDHWFDRSICPEPCGAMHNVCVECGLIKGGCLVASAGRENGNRLAVAWLAVADLLTGEALAPSEWNLAAVIVARAYLGEAS